MLLNATSCCVHGTLHSSMQFTGVLVDILRPVYTGAKYYICSQLWLKLKSKRARCCCYITSRQLWSTNTFNTSLYAVAHLYSMHLSKHKQLLNIVSAIFHLKNRIYEKKLIIDFILRYFLINTRSKRGEATVYRNALASIFCGEAIGGRVKLW